MSKQTKDELAERQERFDRLKDHGDKSKQVQSHLEGLLELLASMKPAPGKQLPYLGRITELEKSIGHVLMDAKDFAGFFKRELAAVKEKL